MEGINNYDPPIEFPQLRGTNEFEDFGNGAKLMDVFDPFIKYARYNDRTGYKYMDFVINRYYTLFHDTQPKDYPSLPMTAVKVRKILLNFWATGDDRKLVTEFYKDYKYGTNE